MLLLAVLLLSSVAVSLAGDTIYGWYYGRQLAEFLRTVNSYLSSGDFTLLWKVVVGLAVIFTLLSIVASFGDYRQSIRLFKFFAVVIFVWYLGNAAKTTVNVEDRCTGETFSNIEVPWAIGKAVAYATTLEKNIRDGLVNFFGSSLPDSYKNHEGCFTGYELLKPALVYYPRDPYLRLSIKNYLKDCLIPTVLAGDIDRTALENSTDLWRNVFPCSLGQTCMALTTTYYSSVYPEGIVDSCPNAYARIDADIANEYSQAWSHIKAMVFGGGTSIADSDIPLYLGEASTYLMATALTGENLIRQSMSIQALNGVSAEFATAIAYQEAYLSALAKINMLDFGRGGTLNAMKGVIQVMLVGLTPAFFVLFITPLGGRIFQGWITFFVWLIAWSIAEVITVSMLYLYLGNNYKFDFTLADIDKLVFTFNKAAQISSLMSDWIPLITLAVVTGSVYSLTHFAKGMSKELRDEHGVKVMASGNFDAGNVRVNNFSQATKALATSAVGTVSYDTVQANITRADEFVNDITQTNQFQVYDPETKTNFRGVPEGNNTYLGQVEGGTFKGSGRWLEQGGHLRLLNGTAEVTTPKALSMITGGQLDNLMNAKVNMKDGKVVYAHGIDQNTGASVTYSRSDDGIETMDYRLGGASVKMVKDKNGEWRVVSADSPVSLKFAEQYAENLSNAKSQMDRLSYLFKKGEGISNADSETFIAGYKQAYEIAHGRGGATETERGFARDLIASTEEQALTKLGEEGKVSLEGRKIDELEARKRMQGGIGIDTRALDKVLPKHFKLRPGFDIEKAIATKDGYVVQDSKGQYWFFGKNEQINEALKDAYKTTIGGENKDFLEKRERTTGQDYTDHSFKTDLQSFRNRMAEYSAQRSKELQKKIDYVNKNARELGTNLTHMLLGNMIKEADGSNIEEKTGNALLNFNRLLSTPEGINRIQEMGDNILDSVLKDRSLSKPDVDESVVNRTGEYAERQSSQVEGAGIRKPGRKPENVYRQKKANIESKDEEIGKNYNDHRNMVEVQKEVYEQNMKSPTEKLNLLNQAQDINKDLNELFTKKAELKDYIDREKRDLRGDMVTYSGAFSSFGVGDMMELITDEEKLKAYENQIRNAPPHERLKPDPNVLWSFRERWLNIQDREKELQKVNEQIAQKAKQFEEISNLMIARDMQEGNYEVKYRDDKGPGKRPGIETRNESTVQETNKNLNQLRQEEIQKDPQKFREELRKKLRERDKGYFDALEDLLG